MIKWMQEAVARVARAMRRETNPSVTNLGRSEQELIMEEGRLG